MKKIIIFIIEYIPVYLLVSNIKKETNEEKIRHMIYKLGHYSSKSSTKALANIVKNNKDSLLRNIAIILLGKRNNKEAKLALKYALNNDLWFTNRQKAKELLGVEKC